METIMGVAKFERLFRKAAGLDVDKSDLKRLSDFINQKLYDLLLIGESKAKANNRDIIEPWDLPITKGLQESINEFKQIEEELELKPILEQLAKVSKLDLEYSYQTQQKLPEIVGALTISLAKTFKVIDPQIKNPEAQHWERAFSIFNMLL
jgi:hypothetical protein